MREADAFRVNYTPLENAWAQGQSGFLYIAEDKGNNLAMVEGPVFNTEAGSDLMYVFKSNGDIQAIVGKPDVDGSQGTLDVRLVASGLRVRPRSIQVSPSGMFFGVLFGAKYNIYFVPHNNALLTRDTIVNLTEHFDFGTDLYFDNSTYTIKEACELINGDQYIICFPSSTSGIPSTNGYMYVCDLYKDGQQIKGRWSRLREHTEDEYEESSGNTVASGGAPSTLGFYYHDGDLMRTYQIKTAHDFAGTTRYYEIAQYGWYAGGEECKSSYLYTYGSYTTVEATDHFYATFKTGALTWGETLNLNKLLFDFDIVGGASANGVDLTLTFYGDLASAAVWTKTMADLTDASAALNILTEVRQAQGINCTQRWFQFNFKFDNIRYVNKPAYVLLRNFAMEVAMLSDKGLTAFENQA